MGKIHFQNISEKHTNNLLVSLS